MSAPYDPATLRRIRAGASAADLGWGREFYLRVCKDHHLEPVGGPATAPPPALPIVVGHVSYDPATGIIRRGFNDVLLIGAREKAVFGYLISLASTGDETLVSRTTLIEHTGECAEHQIGAALLKLQSRLGPVGCHLAIHQGKNGGARLVVRP